jgi:hypothetical protein
VSATHSQLGLFKSPQTFCPLYSFTPRNLSEFVTTLTELNAIAPAAKD